MNEASRFRDRSQGYTPQAGSTASSNEGGLNIDPDSEEYEGEGSSSSSKKNYADRLQNPGQFGATEALWGAEHYWDMTRQFNLKHQTQALDPSDMRLLNSTGAWETGYEKSGLNIVDEDGNPGFSQYAPTKPANQNNFGIIYYHEADRDRRAYLQQRLYEAGLVKRKNPEPKGGWGSVLDKDYATAWERAIELSSQSKIPLFVLLEQEAEYLKSRGGPGGDGGKGGRGPVRPTVQVISNEDAQEVLDNVAKNELGRKLSASEKKVASSIIKAIQDKQAAEQNAYIDQSMKGGGTVEAPTNPQTTATNEVEGRFKNESKAYDLAQAFANLVGLTGGN